MTTKKTSYTPGPWAIDSHSSEPQDGEAMLIYRPDDGRGQSTFRAIADMRPSIGNVADAHLIAAAPTMCEALERIFDMCLDGPEDMPLGSFLARIQQIAGDALEATA